MKPVLFALPGNENLTQKLVRHLGAEAGAAEIRKFPDDETYIRIKSDVRNKEVVLVCSLYHPDSQFVPLYFMAQTARELGASSVCLVAPYLAYMRQDEQFLPGEGLTSSYFGALLSGLADRLVTVDPHLHRTKALKEVVSIPAMVVHAANDISQWIKEHIPNPVIIGPDSESEQWVAEVARMHGFPFIVLDKIRTGDKEVEITASPMEKWQQHQPVLIDDIISSGATMLEAMVHIKKSGLKPPVCISIHAVFSENAYVKLMEAGVVDILTCNTISHAGHQIDISETLARGIVNS